MITVSNVTKKFYGNSVLGGVSFVLNRGERASIIGPGGCGKTTLLKVILGLEPFDNGYISLLGETESHGVNDFVNKSKDYYKKRTETLKKIGMAFQHGGLFDFMTVMDNLFFAMEHMTSLSKSEMKDRANELLSEVKLPATKDMYPSDLSGGMVRRIGIARALCTNPSLAIFDEPTSGLDPVTSSIILGMISNLANRSSSLGDSDVSLLISTSNVEIAIRFAHRVIILNNAKICADGDWRELILDGDPWVKNFLGTRFIGLDKSYAMELKLPEKFINMHW